MKKIMLLLIIFILISCGETEEKTVVEETGRIVNEYVDTLESSVGDAKAVRDLMNQGQQNL